MSSVAKIRSFEPLTHLAILYRDRRDRRKSPGVPGAAIAIFADRRDRRIKSPISGMHSPSVPDPAIFYANRCKLPVKSINQVGRFYHMNNVEVPHRRDRRKKSPGVFASIAGDQIRRDGRSKIARCIAGFSNDDGDGNETVKKATGLITKTTTLHVHYTF